MTFLSIALSAAIVVVGVLSGYTLCQWRFAASIEERRVHFKRLLSRLIFLSALWIDLLFHINNLKNDIFRLFPLSMAVIGLALIVHTESIKKHTAIQNRTE
ncbi:hypothetical protein GBSOP10_10995 [Armatimonadetes bacterium GBS]|jgi:hypothetical protein|nr:hypothetical protein GBSOP10_10995 [Armatimonadetes bacterium GBS]